MVEPHIAGLNHCAVYTTAPRIKPHAVQTALESSEPQPGLYPDASVQTTPSSAPCESDRIRVPVPAAGPASASHALCAQPRLWSISTLCALRATLISTHAPRIPMHSTRCACGHSRPSHAQFSVHRNPERCVDHHKPRPHVAAARCRCRWFSPTKASSSAEGADSGTQSQSRAQLSHQRCASQ